MDPFVAWDTSSRGLREYWRMHGQCIRVERYFHFSCACGRTTFSAESFVNCSGCGMSLAARRVQKRLWIQGTSHYHGVVVAPGRVGIAVPVDHPADRHEAVIRDFVRVGSFKPDGFTPHPHSGAFGQVLNIFNGHAHIFVPGQNYSICVSLSCLEVQTRAEWDRLQKLRPLDHRGDDNCSARISSFTSPCNGLVVLPA